MKKMKKIIVIIGIVAIINIVGYMAGSQNVNGSMSLSSLVSLSSANAEDVPFDVVCKCTVWGTCRSNGNAEVCASFNGNGFCSNYDSNCGLGT